MESNAITSEAIRDRFQMNSNSKLNRKTKLIQWKFLNERKVARLDKRNRVVK